MKSSMLFVFLLMIISVFCFDSGLYSAELSARAIVDKSLEHQVFDFKKAVSSVRLILKNKKGQQRLRKIRIKSLKAKDGLRKTLVRFLEPADVAGTGFLSIEKKKGDDDQFLFLPVIAKVKRISSSQKGSSFMGTEYTYGDLSSNDIDSSTYKRLADEKIGNIDCYVIEAFPKSKDDAQYSKKRLWINKKIFIPQRVLFYDKNGREKKVLITEKVKKHKDSWIITQSTMKNLITEKYTVMVVDKLDTDTAITKEEFSKTRLEKF